MAGEVRVGISASLSGQFQTQGRQALAGLRAWAADVNGAGGLVVAGKPTRLPVSVFHYDDESRAESARLATERLLSQDRVHLLMGPYSSVLAQAVAPVAEEHGCVLWNQGGASDSIYQQGYRWVVGILTPASKYLSGLIPLALQADPQIKTLAILHSGSGAFPRVVSGGAEQQARDHGLEALVREFDPATTDFSPDLDAVAEANPDVLVVVGRIQNDLRLAQQLAHRRPTLGVAAVVATPIQQFRDALGDDVEGFIGPSQWEASATYPNDYGPAQQAVMQSLKERSGLAVDYPMAQAYAAGVVAQRCLEESGSLEQKALRKAASDLDFSTFYGRFKIDPETGRQIGRSVALVQWQQGSKVIVWPPEQRQGELTYPCQRGD
jgi:branched-chain amino acid transport system substrate-binding protein